MPEAAAFSSVSSTVGTHHLRDQSADIQGLAWSRLPWWRLRKSSLRVATVRDFLPCSGRC